MKGFIQRACLIAALLCPAVCAHADVAPVEREGKGLITTAVDEGIDLRTLPTKEREAYLIAKAKEVTRNFGPEWLRHKGIRPVVSDSIAIFEDYHYTQPKIQRHVGRPYYRVTFYYDAATRRKVGWSFASFVDIWADDGQPSDIIFGHNYGLNFFFISYEEWLKKGIAKKDKVKFEKMDLSLIEFSRKC